MFAIAVVTMLGMMLIPLVAEDAEADDEPSFRIYWYDSSYTYPIKMTSTSSGNLLDAPDPSGYMYEGYEFIGWADVCDNYIQTIVEEVTIDYLMSVYESEGRTTFDFWMIAMRAEEEPVDTDTGTNWTAWGCLAVVLLCVLALAYVYIRNG